MITKIQASILYGYGYKLWEVKTGVEWLISSVGTSRSFIQNEPDEDHMNIIRYSDNGVKEGFITLNQIGTDYLIMARPMSEITKEIEGVGVPIVELAKIAFPTDEWNCIEGSKVAVSENKKVFSAISKNDDEEYIVSFNTWILNKTGGFISTPNKLSLLQWLYTNHFAVDIPEELITPI